MGHSQIMYQNVILLTVISLTSTVIVKWLPNLSFNLPTNFKDKKLPCSKQTVIFPETITGSVKMESFIDVAGFILPEEGEIFLDNAVISLGADAADTNCSEGKTYYMDMSSSSWAQADVWSSSRFTEATPDSERLPCFNDIVEFPADAKFTVRLPNLVQTVRELKIGNKSYANEEFLRLVVSETTEMQQFVRNDYYGTGLRIKDELDNQNKFGTICQERQLKIDCSKKFCPKPSCIAPVKPLGFCCSLCGGYITFDVDERFDMTSLKELVDKTVDDYRNIVAYHIGVASILPTYKIQLVIVDKGEYVGTSAELINDISNSVSNHWYKGEKNAQISGSPLYKAGLGGKITVSMFFAVVLVMGAIYIYYYKLPNVGNQVFLTRSRGMFSRFQRRTDSVVSLTRRDSGAMPVMRTAFRNPLYDSKRGRVQVEESVVEEE